MLNPGVQPLLLVIIVAWIGLPYLIAFLGGWRKLAVHYRWNGEPVAKQWFRWRSASMNFTHYGSSLNIGTSERGLFLKPILIAAIGHPPLFIPWQDITVTETKRVFIPVTELSFLKEPRVKVTLTRGLASRVLACRPGTSSFSR